MAKREWALVIGLTALLVVPGAWPAAAVDEVWLADGSRLQGDVDERDLTLVTPHGAYRVSREHVRRLVVGQGATGDSAELRNGNRVSGYVDRAAYGVRMAGGTSRTLDRNEVAFVVFGPVQSGETGRLTDVITLVNGDHVFGEVVTRDVALALPSGTQRYGRDTVWRIVLDSAVGDTLQLQNGSQVSGVVEQPAYEIRTLDGQVVTFGRNEVRVVVFQPPPAPRAARVPPTIVSVSSAPTGSGQPALAAVPPAALPPAIRAALRDLQFEFDRWELTPEARRTLEELAASMKAYPKLSVLIEGHADERGTTEYNLALGARRAQAARDYLLTLGIAAERLEIVSYGEERPLDPRHTELAWAMNRRAHFVVRAQ